MSKIVVLNSGGFDSVVLVNYLHFIQGENEINSLHFLYGALNEKEQLKCVEKVCERVNATHRVVTIPPINWTRSNFFTEGEYEVGSQYLEYRNLIFLAYAISYAESIGADKIYVAFLNNSKYTDDSAEFLDKLNNICLGSNILIDAPFVFDSKHRLWHIAQYLSIKEGDYFSCDKPTLDGKPCGECLDCLTLRELEELKIKF